MILQLCHPEVAYRSCEDCKAWMYDDNGEVNRDRNGKPRARPKGAKTPCEYPGQYKDADHPAGTRCPKVSPESNAELSQENQMSYQHYLECRAVGQFPDDGIVRRNAATILQIEQMVDRMNSNQALRNIIQSTRRR